jgi:hypothetical protein
MSRSKGGRLEASLTTTSYALLGLLNIRPWTYRTRQQVQRLRLVRAERNSTSRSGWSSGLAPPRPDPPESAAPCARSPDDRRVEAWLDEAPAPRQFDIGQVFFADGGTLAQLRTTIDRIRHPATDRRDVAG